MSFIDTHLGFLKATRFWKLVLGAILTIVLKEGYVPNEVASSVIEALIGILGGSILVRTIDRLGEHSGDYTGVKKNDTNTVSQIEIVETKPEPFAVNEDDK